MRVTLVYLGRRGGGAAYSILMATALAKRCDVLSVVSSHAENIADWRKSATNLVQVPTFTNVAGAALSLLDAPRHLRLRSRISGFAPDVIYYPMGHLWTPIINALFPAVPKVFTLHDPVPHVGERNAILRLVQRLSVHQSTRLIVLTDHCARLTAALGAPERCIDVVPHGELSVYARSRTEPPGREPRRDGNTLLFFGRISRYKGLDVLLEAFAEIKKRRPASRLLVVGSGDLRPYSRALSTLDGVTVVNEWIPDSAVHPFFARSDLVVLPYVDGSQSGVIPLASASGLPVVTSDVGGLAEQVEHGKTGLIVPAGDVHALAEACVHLLGSPGLRAAMGAEAARKARSEWSWDAAAGKVLESLERAVGRSCGRRDEVRANGH